ncbi:MAG: glycosyltransferase family 8 protein, partial [Longimonas sp.]|uniref:glycosyltransferase family 8 protein n=1 Tax=Longimonas sp. TaxID=2039626 RepID=UPI00397481BA
MADLLPSHRLTFVLSADDAYARPLAVAAYSALAHLAPNWSADIYVIDGGISAAHRARIARVVEAAPAPTTLHWLTVRPDRVQDLPVLNDWISTSAYLRLYLPELLPNTCERVIYLDSDLLVNASLVPLWTEPLDEVALCAVQDYYTPYVSSTRGLDYYQELDLSPRTPYFNAGVMAINLSYWRAHNIGQTALQYIETYRDRLNFHDQEGLNAAVAGRWKPLDPTWNLFVTPDRLKHVPHSEVRSA